MNMTIIAHARKYAAAATKFFERERELTFVSSSFEAHLIIYKQQHLIICRQQHVCHKQSVTDTGKQRHQVFRERELPQRVSDRALFVSAACVVDMLYSFNTTPVLLICCTLYDSSVVDMLYVISLLCR